MYKRRTWLGSAAATALAAALTGCGTPGAPQPPSLKLPNRVTDLSGVRAGDTVTLTWTMPRRNTDKILLKSDIDVEVCRAEGDARCQAVAQLKFAPGADASFSDKLPPSLTAGAPRVLNYCVELKNTNGRSAGLSEAAAVAAGAAPPPIQDLAAEVRKSGIVLRWRTEPADADVRLLRTLLTPSESKPRQGLSAPPVQALAQNLLIPSAQAQAGRALDSSIALGNAYEYRAQRVTRLAVNGETLELDGAISPPIRVDALDVFPPATPTGLAAVATAPDAAGAQPSSIDLSWEPNTESDLAGYNVYRREGDAWQRISGDQPLVGPAFHDAHVQPGQTYRYAVTAVDRTGHESPHSTEAQETVPNPN